VRRLAALLATAKPVFPAERRVVSLIGIVDALVVFVIGIFGWLVGAAPLENVSDLLQLDLDVREDGLESVS
jgi:hypothetical protein